MESVDNKRVRTYYVYVLRNPMKDGKIFYVGKASHRKGIQYNSPIARHLTEAKNGNNTYKCNVIRKILRNGFPVGFEIIKYLNTDKQALEFETYYANEIGYENLSNTALCGLIGPDMTSEVTKKKLKRLMIKLWADPEWKKKRSAQLTGRKFSEEAKKNLSRIAKVKNNTPEFKETISKAGRKFWDKAHRDTEYMECYRDICKQGQKKRSLDPEYKDKMKKFSMSRKGKSVSEETRSKMSESAKKRCENLEYRKVLVINGRKGGKIRGLQLTASKLVHDIPMQMYRMQ